MVSELSLYLYRGKIYPADIHLTEKRSACFVADAPFEVGLFTFVLVSAAGMFPPPRPALSAERPEQRRISFADSPRCHGSVDGLPRTCGWTGHPRTGPRKPSSSSRSMASPEIFILSNRLYLAFRSPFTSIKAQKDFCWRCSTWEHLRRDRWSR